MAFSPAENEVWNLQKDLNDVVEQTASLWEKLNGAHFFITGGTGFIGCWLLETLRHVQITGIARVEATVLTRNADAFRQSRPELAAFPGFDFVQGRVHDFEFPCASFTHILHAATEPSNRYRGKPEELFDTVIDGTRRVLELALRSGRPRVLILSSGAIYGMQPPGLERIDETCRSAPDCTEPGAAYAEVKRCAEMMAAVHAEYHDLPVVIARIFTLIGPYMPLQEQFAAGNFLEDALAGSVVKVSGDGTALRSFLYAADLVVWLLHLLQLGQSGRAYNVGSECAVSIGELAQATAEIAGNRNYEILGTPIPGALPARYVPDTSRIRSELGVRERVSLKEAIYRSACWYKMSV